MRISEILTPSFRELRQELELPRPAKAVVQVSADSDFCREVVAKGWLTEEQMVERVARLGADCPFFIGGRAVYAEGIGERLTPIGLSLKGLYIAIVRPDIPVPTKEAFALIRPARPQKNCRVIVSQPVETWRDELVNDFERSVFALHPEIAAIKEQLYELGAVYAAMSGSGSAVFGLFRDEISLEGEFEGMFRRVLRL